MPTEKKDQSQQSSSSPLWMTQELYQSISDKFDEKNKSAWTTKEIADEMTAILCDPDFFKAYVESNKEQLKKLGFLSKEEYDLDDKNNPLNQDLSHLSEEEGLKIAKSSMDTAAKILIKTTHALNIIAPMAAKYITNAKAEFVLTFVKFEHTHEHREP